jgi:hypothetical protein
MEIVVNGRGVAHWDGDVTLPFRAFKTLEQLVKKGYMERIAHMRSEWYRATTKAKALKCPDCTDGKVYANDETTNYDVAVGKCLTCAGSCIKEPTP